MSFKLRGCVIKIDYLFILVLTAAALSGSRDLLQVLAFSSLHELGHLTALFICGGKPSSLTLSYYGFALRYDSVLSRAQETAVLLCGPAVNLLIYAFLRDDINLILLFINLLPIYPLDGGRILKLYFFKASRFVSIFFLISVYALSLWLVIDGGSFSMLLIALYLTVYSLNYD